MHGHLNIKQRLVLVFTDGVACSGHVLRQHVSSVGSASSVVDLVSEELRCSVISLCSDYNVPSKRGKQIHKSYILCGNWADVGIPGQEGATIFEKYFTSINSQNDIKMRSLQIFIRLKI